uniref:SOC-1 n=1 Tax=Oesophagostomum dentatum TaxID=61180 RepID=L7MLG6_OESDE
MTDSIYTEGWLIRSRDRGMHFPPFKSKWVRRYFVLRVLDRTLGTYVLDEFRKEDKRRLRKSLDLTQCVQIDSHLQLADSSCSTTSRFGGFQWIFSLYFTKGTNSNKKTPVYFVAESEEKMKDWVYNLCRACRLEKETDDDNNSYLQQQPPEMEAPSHRSTLPSSIAALSIYSDRSSESMLDTPRSEVSRDFERSKRPNYHSRNLRNHHNAQRHPPVSSRKSSLQRRHRRTDSTEVPRASSSASACSSITSDRRSEDGDDDSTSCISQMSNLSCGPPIPPRTRLAPQYSSASSSTGTPVKKFDLSQTLPPSIHGVIDETLDNDSSGETIKMHGIVTYANSQCSSDVGFRALSAYEPPAVDRSNKPAKLRLYDYDEDKVPEAMTIHGYNKSGTNFTRVPHTPQVKNSSRYRDIRDPPRSAGPHGRSRELDYFNPVPLERARSVRSPAPADIEYIKIDAEKTQAVKHSIAQRGTVE